MNWIIGWFSNFIDKIYILRFVAAKTSYVLSIAGVVKILSEFYNLLSFAANFLNNFLFVWSENISLLHGILFQYKWKLKQFSFFQSKKQTKIQNIYVFMSILWKSNKTLFQILFLFQKFLFVGGFVSEKSHFLFCW